MSRLHFKFEFKTRELNELDVPVEVREPDFALVARALSSESVPVAPGAYYVMARMPAGQRLYGQVEISEGEAAEVLLLTPATGREPQAGWEEVDHFLGVRRDSGDEQTASAKATVSLQVLRGNPLTGAVAVAREYQLSESKLRTPQRFEGAAGDDAGMRLLAMDEDDGGAFDDQ